MYTNINSRGKTKWMEHIWVYILRVSLNTSWMVNITNKVLYDRIPKVTVSPIRKQRL